MLTPAVLITSPRSPTRTRRPLNSQRLESQQEIIMSNTQTNPLTNFLRDHAKKLPVYYKNYRWEGKHKLFGYPADEYPYFLWITSLERRFAWLRNHSKIQQTAGIYLFQEMIEWGGSQNGILQRFYDGIGEVNLRDLVEQIIDNLDNPEKAIDAALELPGCGLTYASKILRFMEPKMYGALDSRIRAALTKENLLKKIYDGQSHSVIEGYTDYIALLSDIRSHLEQSKIPKPVCQGRNDHDWTHAEIEMALFQWAS